MTIDPARLVRLHRLMAPEISLDRTWNEIREKRPTSKATVDAVVLAVRDRGLGALEEPTTAQRPAECDAAARAEITRQISLIFGDADDPRS